MVKSSDESFFNYIWVNCYITAKKISERLKVFQIFFVLYLLVHLR